MRKLNVDASKDLVTPDVLSVLQLRTGNEPLLPGLRVFDCEAVSEAFVSFIPLFLSPGTTEISITFTADAPTVLVASTIVRFSTLCPSIEYLALIRLPQNRAITEAVSEMLLACNRDTLRVFCVKCPLTDAARGFLHSLPKLRQVWIFTQGQTSLPPFTLPNLQQIHVEWDYGHDWLQGFCGVTFGKLKTVTFRPVPGSAQIGGFLEDFQSVALSASFQNTLSDFKIFASQSWNPNYSSLLVFEQMRVLEIQFSCHNGCSSTVDDDIVTNLARAMPKLEILRLGRAPCSTPTGVTLRGLIALSCHCPQLSGLRIHVRARELGEAAIGNEPPLPSENTAVIPRVDCALTNLQVGEAPIPQEVAPAVALTLLKVFPRIVDIEHANPLWGKVMEMIELFRRIGNHVDHASKARLLYLKCSLVTSSQETHLHRKSIRERLGVTALAILPYT